MRLFVIAIATATALSGCVQTNPNVYDPYTVGQASLTETGTIQASRQVEISSAGGTGIGAAVGALAGGIAGSQIGPSRRGHYGHRYRRNSAVSALGALGGAVVGGLIGAAIERDVTRHIATEYVVRLDDGTLITVIQGSEPIALGQRVFVQVPERGRARIVPAV